MPRIAKEHAHGYENEADRPQDAGLKDEAENQQDSAEHDHVGVGNRELEFGGVSSARLRP